MDFIHAAGELRHLACLPGKASYDGIDAWEAQQPVIPRSQWQPTTLTQFPAPILNQGSSSACVGFSFATAFRRAWEISGQQDKNWNPFFTYGLINNGVDKGSIVGDAVDSALKYGMACIGNLPDGDLPYQLWFPQQLQQLSLVLAKASHFKVGRAYHLKGPDIFSQLVSSLLLGYTCISGIYVGRNFSNLDASGIAPLPDIIAGGHALAHIGVVNISNTWYLLTQNSWGVSWGRNGTCLLSEHAWDGMGDALAIAAESQDPSDQSWPGAK